VLRTQGGEENASARIDVRISDSVFKQPGRNEFCAPLRAQAKQSIVRAAKQKTGLLHRFCSSEETVS
jgi:hypothetical protein